MMSTCQLRLLCLLPLLLQIAQEKFGKSFEELGTNEQKVRPCDWLAAVVGRFNR